MAELELELVGVLDSEHPPLLAAVSSLAALASPACVFTGHADGLVVRWALAESRLVPESVCVGHATCVSALCALPLDSGECAASASSDAHVRVWRSADGECVAHAALPSTSPLSALACCASTCHLAAYTSTAIFVLRGATLELTRVLRGSELPRQALLALSVSAAEVHTSQPPKFGSSASLSSLSSVRAEEEPLLLQGVESGGSVWSWSGCAQGDKADSRPSRPSSAAPLALLGWAREEAGAEAAAAPRAPPRPPHSAASLSHDGSHALLVSTAGWAVVSTARPAPGALPAPAVASGEAERLVGGAFLSPSEAGAARIALLSADGTLRLLELGELAARRPPPPRLLLSAHLHASALLCQSGAQLVAAHGEQEEVQLDLFALPALAPLRPPPPAQPLAFARLADGWPRACADEEGACTASLISDTTLVRGHERGGISLTSMSSAAPRIWLSGHAGKVRSLAATPAALLSGGNDCCVRVWSWAGVPLCALRHHVAPVLALHSQPAAPLLLSESADGSLGLLRLHEEGGWFCERLLPWPGASPPTAALTQLAWASGSGSLGVWWGEEVHVWDALSGSLDRVACGAAAEELRLLLEPAPAAAALAAPIGSSCALPWAPLLRLDAGQLEGEQAQIPFALSLLHAWGVDAALDAQLRTILPACSPQLCLAPALGGAAGAFALLTPRGAERRVLLARSSRFVARRSLAVCALARRLQRVGAMAEAAASLLAFYAVQLQDCPLDEGLRPAPPALAVLLASWQHSSECVREAARALLASAPPEAVPHQLREGDVSCWRAIEATAGGAPDGSPACTGRLGVLVAAGCAVSSLLRSEGDDASRGLYPANHPHVLAALRRLSRDAPDPHGAAALALLAAGLPAWWGCLRSEDERLELGGDTLVLCERLAGGAGGTRAGGALELMVAREASSQLLQALAEVSPPVFLDALAQRLQTGPVDSAAHMSAFLALIHSLQERGGARLLRPHLDRCLEAACLALQPQAASLQAASSVFSAVSGQLARRSCAAGAAGFLVELALRSPSHVSLHRPSGRMAVGCARGSGAVLRVYDVGAGGPGGQAPATGLVRSLKGEEEAAGAGAASRECAALAFDADGGRLAAYHHDARGGGGLLRFWVLSGGSGWRLTRGLPPARSCVVAPLSRDALAAGLRLDWVTGIGAGVALLQAAGAGSALAFLSVVPPH